MRAAEGRRMNRGQALSLALHLSGTLLFSLLIPLLVGIWLDKKLDASPLFTLVGAVLGILAATVGVARLVLRAFSPAGNGSPAQQLEAQDEEEPE